MRTVNIIAYKSITAFHILGIIDITDEYVVCVWCDKNLPITKFHKVRLHYNTKGVYFKLNSIRYYTDEFLKCDLMAPVEDNVKIPD